MLSRVYSSGSEPMGYIPSVKSLSPKILTFQFIAAKLQSWSSNDIYFMVVGHHNIGSLLKGHNIRKVEPLVYMKNNLEN